MPRSIMMIAGETSGDRVAAELVEALRSEMATLPNRREDLQPVRKEIAPRFFGAGGPAMAAAGVDVRIDMMSHAVTGLTDVIKSLGHFRRLFHAIKKLAIERHPELLICVDFSGFNGQFARNLLRAVRKESGAFANWNPRIVQFVSPQVWASRPGRAWKLARSADLLLSIIPFEKAWYADRLPEFNVQFIGHPIVDRYKQFQSPAPPIVGAPPIVALLPGSRASELNRHLPPILDAVARIDSVTRAQFKMVLPDERMLSIAQSHNIPSKIEIEIGGLPELLSTTTIAIASTGTVTMECAYFGVPTVAMYKTSEITFQIGKRVATVTRMAMPNLIADDDVFPEFIQNDATGANLADAALNWLNNPEKLDVVRKKLAEVVKSLGKPGAPNRAARAILDLF